MRGIIISMLVLGVMSGQMVLAAERERRSHRQATDESWKKGFIDDYFRLTYTMGNYWRDGEPLDADARRSANLLNARLVGRINVAIQKKYAARFADPFYYGDENTAAAVFKWLDEGVRTYLKILNRPDNDRGSLRSRAMARVDLQQYYSQMALAASLVVGLARGAQGVDKELIAYMRERFILVFEDDLKRDGKLLAGQLGFDPGGKAVAGYMVFYDFLMKELTEGYIQ